MDPSPGPEQGLGAHLFTGQPYPEGRVQPSGGLSKEGLRVGVGHVRQAGVAALTQQEGVMPAQGLLQQPEGAVEVGELSARGRGPRGWGWAQRGVYMEVDRAQALLPSPPFPGMRLGLRQASGRDGVPTRHGSWHRLLTLSVSHRYEQ